MTSPVETLVLTRLVLSSKGNLAAGSGGITSSFTSPTGQVVNVVNGVITNVCGNGAGAANPTNPDYFANLTASIGTATTCNELQGQVDNIFSAIQDQVDDVNAQLAALLPILALLSAPGDPTAVITWIGNFITGFLTPYVIPYTTFATQLTQLTTAVAALTSAITTAAGKIPGCSIVIPPITGI
jgi:hypothetical protein